jgi:hypothetical protein
VIAGDDADVELVAQHLHEIRDRSRGAASAEAWEVVVDEAENDGSMHAGYSVIVLGRGCMVVPGRMGRVPVLRAFEDASAGEPSRVTVGRGKDCLGGDGCFAASMCLLETGPRDRGDGSMPPRCRSSMPLLDPRTTAWGRANLTEALWSSIGSGGDVDVAHRGNAPE